MKALNYWQQFVHTGKVDDYLAYVEQEESGGERKQKEEAGARHDAGVYMCDRNDTEADARWGI